MSYESYQLLNVEVTGGVAWVTIDHPPINLFDIALIQEMSAVGPQLAADDAVRVVVVQSANPDFFIAHADVELILQMPDNVPEKPKELFMFHQMVECFRTMPKATIGKIAGIARGGGSEFLLSLDMRFAAIGSTTLSQPEVAIGILPGGSGTQRLPALMGRSRALEVILGCEDYSAELAERYGYINRALPADELDAFVERLALRIASFPASAVALAKHSVDAGARSPVEGLLEETYSFNQLLATDDAKRRMAQFMELGAQTRDGELNLDTVLEGLDR